MGAPQKYEEEFRDRAVRIYRDRLAERTETGLAVRREVGNLLDLNPGTVRTWIGDAERQCRPRCPVPGTDSEEVPALRKRVAELKRAHDILKTACAFLAQGQLKARLK